MDNRPPSVLMCVGRKFYKLHEMVEEYQDMGISKRIPVTSIPEGLEPMVSKVFVTHPDAIIRVTAKDRTLTDLAQALHDETLLDEDDVLNVAGMEMDFWTGEELKADDYVPPAMLALAMAYSRSKNKSLLESAYKVETCMGVVGFGYLNRIEYVVREGEEDLPEELAHLEDEIELVHYEYEDEK